MKFFNDKTIPKKWFIVIFGIKIIAGICLTLVYTYYYTDRGNADIYKYFDDSKYLFDALKDKPLDFIKMVLGLDFNSTYFDNKYYLEMSHWHRPYNNDLFNDSHIIIRFNAFVRLFSFGHFMVHNVFINFISIIGLTFLFKAFKSFSPKNNKLLFYAIFLAPSIFFWGSGVLKESIIFFGFGLLIFHLLKFTKKANYLSPIYIIIALFILAFSKFYIVATLFIPVLGYIFNHYFKLKRIILGYIFATTVFISSIAITPFVIPKLNFVQQIVNKQNAFSRFIASIPTNSGFKIAELTDASSLILNIPNALLNTFIRPYFGECNSLFVWLSAFENHLLLIFIVFTFYFRKKIKTPQKNILLFNVSFVLALFILIGLTTPVFGAIMRYKIPGTLLLLISLALLIDIYKVKKTFPFLKKII